MKRNPRILFFSESVTLAHFGRAVTLAQSLSPTQYQIGFASSMGYRGFLPPNNWELFNLNSVLPSEFAYKVKRGKLPYNLKILRDYVEEDLKAIDSFKPDIIIGDFRLSLSTSARLRKIPYGNLINAYWHRNAESQCDVPETYPLTVLLPHWLSVLFFHTVKPIVFHQLTKPFNRLRQHYGLPPISQDLLKIYTDGDFTLFDDAEEIVPLRTPAQNTTYLGPLNWSVPTPSPDWLRHNSGQRDLILISLGSSGSHQALAPLLNGLRDRKEKIVVITAGQNGPDAATFPSVRFTSYLSIKECLPLCKLMITNGGISGYHALAAGVPVLGIPNNMDQYLCSQRIEDYGAGLTLRGDTLSSSKVANAVARLLEENAITEKAKRAAGSIRTYDYRKIFSSVILEKLNKH